MDFINDLRPIVEFMFSGSLMSGLVWAAILFPLGAIFGWTSDDDDWWDSSGDCGGD